MERLLNLLRLALLILLVLLLRQLAWCLKWLWRYSHGQEPPEPISFLPRRTGDTFRGHIRDEDGE